MRSSVAISLVISLLFAGNAFTIKYTGSEQLSGYVLAEPHSGGGGNSFELPVDFQLSMTVDLDPFQSLTITDFTIQATPVALDFPDFNGNVTLTIDELLLQQKEAFTVDLNPAVGGVFKTANVGIGYSCCQVELSGKWDNFGLHENLASKQTAASVFFAREYQKDIFTIDPSTYLDGLKFVAKFYDDSYDRDFIDYPPAFVPG